MSTTVVSKLIVAASLLVSPARRIGSLDFRRRQPACGQ